MTHNEVETVETDSQLTEMLELAEKNIETVIITVFHMFIKLSRHMEDIFLKGSNRTSRDENHNV